MGLLDIVKRRNNDLVTKEDNIKPINNLNVNYRIKAMEKLSFVKLVEKTKKDRRVNAQAACDFVAFNFTSSFPILLRGGKNGASQLTYHNFRRWRGDIKNVQDSERALEILADKYVSGIRNAEERENSPFWLCFFGLYLNENRLPIAVAYKKTIQKMRKDFPQIEIPTLHQVQYRVNQLPQDKVILGREGETAFRNKCVDYIQRDWGSVIAGELVIADSRDFDTRVKVWDKKRDCWVATRPKIAGFLDARSWYLASYWITAEPVNHRTLIDTLGLYLCSTQGVAPAVCYFDNGKDYCAQGFSTPLQIEGGREHSIFKELGIQLVNAIPFNARAKTIERMFKDMMENFDKMFADYLGSRVGQRTLAADYYDKHPEELPSLQELCVEFDKWLYDYHNTPKHGNIHQGKTPAEIWNSRPEKVAFTGEQLRYALLKPEAVRQVGRGPSVAWNRELFYCDNLKYGDKVLIKSDRLDGTHIYCYTLDGALIGEALTRTRVKAMALDDADARAQIGELIARQRRQIKEAKTILRDMTGGLHQLSPQELFLADGMPEIKQLGVVRSVKGAAHTYAKMGVKNLEFREDKKELELEQVHQHLVKEKEQAEEMDLQDIHSFMTNRKNNKGDDLL